MLRTIEDSSSLQVLLSKSPEFSLVASDVNDKIRNPLAVIQSSAELLNIYGQKMTEEEQQALFDSIYQAVFQITNILPKDYCEPNLHND